MWHIYFLVSNYKHFSSNYDIFLSQFRDSLLIVFILGTVNRSSVGAYKIDFTSVPNCVSYGHFACNFDLFIYLS